ncbi:HNH endonuclease [Rhizobium hidalgonense]|nr:HNH endonuclease [Rhizobium hidalgonense]
MSKLAKYRHRRKRQAFELQGGQCGICEAPMVFPGFHNKDRKRNRLAAVSNLATWDHIKPASQGGNSCLENLHLVCFACNQERRTKKAKPTWLSTKARLMRALATSAATCV